MNKDIERISFWKDHLEAARTNISTTLRMNDSILEIVNSQKNMESCPDLCDEIRSISKRIHVSLAERLVALEDLLGYI